MGSSAQVSAEDNHDVILFDGVCNLCSSSVQFIIARDKKSRFKFASLQSSVARQYLKKFSAGKTSEPFSIVLITKNRFYDRSDAVLEIVRYLSGLWPALYAFKIIPKFIRDPVYRLIARNRYRLFGKKDSCMVPTPDLKTRFLD